MLRRFSFVRHGALLRETVSARFCVTAAPASARHPAHDHCERPTRRSPEPNRRDATTRPSHAHRQPTSTAHTLKQQQPHVSDHSHRVAVPSRRLPLCRCRTLTSPDGTRTRARTRRHRPSPHTHARAHHNVGATTTALRQTTISHRSLAPLSFPSLFLSPCTSST